MRDNSVSEGSSMHYVPGILNSHGLFQFLSTLLRSSETSEQAKLTIEQFLYRTSCALVGLERMHGAEATAVMFTRQYLHQVIFSSERRFALSMEPLFEAYAQIPAILTQLVSMQNLSLAILQHAQNVRQSIPKSFRDAIRRGLSAFGFDEDTATIAQQYWNASGKLIRDLRDINEHYTSLVHQTYFFYPNDPGQILILLPDNPEAKSPAHFTYQLERDAFETLSCGIRGIDGFLRQSLAPLRLVEQPFAPSLYLKHMDSLDVPQRRTLGLLVDITKTQSSPNGREVQLQATEILQVIPDGDATGNVAVRKLKLDSEINNRNGAE